MPLNLSVSIVEYSLCTRSLFHCFVSESTGSVSDCSSSSMFGSSTHVPPSSSGLMPAVEGFAAFASMPNPFIPCGNILPQAQNMFGSSLLGSSAMIGGAMVNTTGASHNSAFGKSADHASGTSGGIGFGYSSYAGFGQPTSAPSSRSSLFADPASFSLDSFALGRPTSTRRVVEAPSFFLGNQSFPLEAQTRTLAHGSNSFAQMFPNGCRGSRVAAYKPEVERDSQRGPGIVVSILSMPAYSNKSHEELRWEDYQLGDKGGWTQKWTNGAPPLPFWNNGTGLLSSTAEVHKPSLVSISSMPTYTKKSHELLRWEDYQLGDKGGPATKQQKGGAGLGQHFGMGSRVAAYTSTPEDVYSTQPVETPLPIPCNVPVPTQIRYGSTSIPPVSRIVKVRGRRLTSTNEVYGQRRVRFNEELFSTAPFKQNSNEELGRMYYRSTDTDNSSENFTFSFREEGTKSPNGSYSFTSTQNGALNISEPGNVAIPDDERNIKSRMPKLRRPEYYTEPRIEDLDLTKRVSSFVVGRHGYGSIRFLGEIDLKNVDLDSSIQFNEREVIGLTDVTKKTQAGEVSNTLAEVTLLNIKCIDKSSGKQYVNGPQVDKYKEMLIKKTTEHGAEFVSYDSVTGEWKFRVPFQL